MVAATQPGRLRGLPDTLCGLLPPAQRSSRLSNARRQSLAFVRSGLEWRNCTSEPDMFWLPCERGCIPSLECLDYAKISGSIEPSGEHGGAVVHAVSNPTNLSMMYAQHHSA